MEEITVEVLLDENTANQITVELTDEAASLLLEWLKEVTGNA